PRRLELLEAAMDAHTGLIWSAVVPLTPVGVTSILRGSWATETVRTGAGVVGIVGNPQIYSEVIERGRRPGARMPPPEALRTWVERKLGFDVSPFVIARSIAQKGIQPVRMLERAVESTRPAAQSLWDRVVSRLLEES
ncbi:MAG TPA: hypothetical protein VNO79_03770, partial [Actinomycetota bacterium]|nr:hypothetical protein [Actinomycetota bacterium]